MLTAAVDSRVAALCLLDPVDNTIYAPLGPGYPSGVQALKNLGQKQVRVGVSCTVMGALHAMQPQHSIHKVDTQRESMQCSNYVCHVEVFCTPAVKVTALSTRLVIQTGQTEKKHGLLVHAGRETNCSACSGRG